MRKRGKRLHHRQPRSKSSGWLFILWAVSPKRPGRVPTWPFSYIDPVCDAMHSNGRDARCISFHVVVFPLSCGNGIKRPGIGTLRHRRRRRGSPSRGASVPTRAAGPSGTAARSNREAVDFKIRLLGFRFDFDLSRFRQSVNSVKHVCGARAGKRAK